MRALVTWLQSVDAEALAELRCFEPAIDDLAAQLWAIWESLEALRRDIEELRRLPPDGPPRTPPSQKTPRATPLRSRSRALQ